MASWSSLSGSMLSSTLAMLIILRGMLVGATSGRTLFDLPDAFYALMTVTLAGLPLAVWLAALAFAVAGFMLLSPASRAHAIGGNAEAARGGIQVERITRGVYVLAGILAAVGGLVTTGYVGASAPSRQRHDFHGVRGGGDRRHLADGGRAPCSAP